MRNITLNSDDNIETVLQEVEAAMETGEICRIHNIDYLGRLGISALILLTMSDSLMDPESGKIFHPKPGFGLIGIDISGFARVLH